MPTPSTDFFTPGAYNTFVPEATAQLQVEFSRAEATFASLQYQQVVPVQKTSGYYPVIDTFEAVRVVTDDDHVWGDGQDAPVGVQRGLKWESFTADRRAYPFTIGELSSDTASFDVVATHARMSATKSMTDLASRGMTLASTAGNWPSANTVADITTLVGAGDWVTSTASNKYIRQSFMLVAEAIHQNTGGVVGPRDIVCVVNPVTARKMSNTDEVHAYMTAHESAMSNLTDMRQLANWGLPPVLYGIRMLVEDAVKVTSRREVDASVANTITYALADDKAVFLSRPGGLIGNAGPSFSTMTSFVQEEMRVETMSDPWNRLIKGRVVDTRDVVLTAPASGYLIQNTST